MTEIEKIKLFLSRLVCDYC